MNKVKAENQETTRMVRREMGRHSVDCGEVQVSVSHGVIHLHGKVRAMRGHEEEFEAAVNGLLKSLRCKTGIREVYPEWSANF